MSTTYPSTPDPAVRIAVIGDVHERWDAVDVSTIDALGYQLVLFTGDLADRMHRRTLDVARRIAPLATPAVLIPGNHDATTPLGVLAEALGRLRTRPGQAGRHAKRLRALRDALGPVSVGGYSLHPVPPVGATDPAITVIAARPHAMDGRRVTFPHAVGVADLDASAARLRALVDAAPGALVFVAHNGPNGLGADRAARVGGRTA
ncbi:MAG: metallophosphoesterase, partial [Myxococcota bacterium]